MRKIDTEEMKKIQLDILLDVAGFCTGHNIRYYLTDGSLLGAVRHKGFIPWDDDIDIAMPRPDYERFIREYSHEYYKCFHWAEDTPALCTYAKVHDSRTLIDENADLGEEIGVNIDVFPIDGLPSGEKNIRRFIRKMNVLWRLVVCATLRDPSERSPAKRTVIRLVKAFYKLVPIQHYITGYAIKYARRYPFEQAEQVSLVVWCDGTFEIMPRSRAVSYTEMDFEGHKLNGLTEYDAFLTRLYGDYMQFPPPEERCCGHGASAFRRD